jgi:hypothetical protein
VEISYFVGAFILLLALIYGTLHSHFSNRRLRKASDQIVRDRTNVTRLDGPILLEGQLGAACLRCMEQGPRARLWRHPC